ncbi:radical SAM protein [Candidatus Riflebacteria bacterium]
MRIQTFSIIAGSAACNAKCPFCISKMTPAQGVELKLPEVNWRNFAIACRLARQNRVTTTMLTSKGEPTLYPELITSYLEHLEPFAFPFIELQTNGILLLEEKEKFKKHMQYWYEKGLSTIAVSIMHFEAEKNRQVYLPHRDSYIDLEALIDLLHSYNFSVRLACVMADGFIDSENELEKMINFAKEHNVEQLTVRPVSEPEKSENEAAARWTSKHFLHKDQLMEIKKFLSENGRELMKLLHGAVVYDVGGQNICLTDCLTLSPEAELIRQLIFFPDGHLRYDWQYPGAILL